MSEGSHERSRWLYGYMIIVSILIIIHWWMRDAFGWVAGDQLLSNRWTLFCAFLLRKLSFMFCCFFSELSWRVISGFWNFFPKLAFDRVLVLLQGTFPCKLHDRISQDFKSGCHVEIVSFWGLRSIDLLQ